MEVAVIVEELGTDVTELKVGDHVAYAMVTDAYAEERLIDDIEKGIVKNYLNQNYYLKDTAITHQNMEDRKTTALTVLIP